MTISAPGRIYEPPLTTVHVPTFDLGYQAMVKMRRILAREEYEHDALAADACRQARDDSGAEKVIKFAASSMIPIRDNAGCGRQHLAAAHFPRSRYAQWEEASGC